MSAKKWHYRREFQGDSVVYYCNYCDFRVRANKKYEDIAKEEIWRHLREVHNIGDAV